MDEFDFVLEPVEKEKGEEDGDGFILEPVKKEDTDVTLSGLGQAALGGVERGFAAMPGVLGDIENLVWAGRSALTGQERDPSTDYLYDSQETIDLYENNIRETYKGQNEWERGVGRMAEFAPAALAPVGGLSRGARLANRALNVAAPALASEGAGQVARQIAPEYEGAARAVGGIAGGMGAAARTMPSRHQGAMNRAAADPRQAEHQRHVQRLREGGVEVSPGQSVNTKKRLDWEGALDDVPGSGSPATRNYLGPQKLSYTRGATQRANIDDLLEGNLPTRENLYGVERQIDSMYREVENAVIVRPDTSFASRLARGARIVEETFPDGPDRTRILNMMNDVQEKMSRGVRDGAGEVLTGSQYVNLRRALTKTMAKTQGDGVDMMSEMIRSLDQNVIDLASGQHASDMVDLIQQTNRRYTGLQVIKDSIDDLGVVQPKKLQSAVRRWNKNDINYERTPIAQWANSGTAVLKNPKDSGTAQRTLMMKALQAPGNIIKQSAGLALPGAHYLDPNYAVGLGAAAFGPAAFANALYSPRARAAMGVAQQGLAPALSASTATRQGNGLTGGIGPRYDEYGNLIE